MVSQMQSNLNIDHLSTMTTIFGFLFQLLYYKTTSEQQPPLNNGHKFGVPKVVVEHRVDFTCV